MTEIKNALRLNAVIQLLADQQILFDTTDPMGKEVHSYLGSVIEQLMDIGQEHGALPRKES